MKKLWMVGLLLGATVAFAQVMGREAGAAAGQGTSGTASTLTSPAAPLEPSASATSSAPAPSSSAAPMAAPTPPEALAPVVAPPPLEPMGKGMPHTEMLDTSKDSGHDPLLEPKPLPKADLSLIGGTVRKVDTVHNRITLQPFGGGDRYVVYFDERSRILSGGQETTVLAVHVGDKIYVDTQALGAQVFAKTIQVRATTGPAHASGQVIEVLGGQVRMQDRLSGETVSFAVNERTKVESREGAATAAALHSGSLVDVTFTTGRKSEAQSIMIHASPGESYVFAGTLTHVNVRDGVMAIDNQVDGNNYELYFDPLEEKSVASLVAGTPVQVTANFDGKRYRATSIRVTGDESQQ